MKNFNPIFALAVTLTATQTFAEQVDLVPKTPHQCIETEVISDHDCYIGNKAGLLEFQDTRPESDRLKRIFGFICNENGSSELHTKLPGFGVISIANPDEYECNSHDLTS